MPKTINNTIAVIVPVHNEEKIIGWVLKELIKVCRLISADIFVVNDGSTDRTLKELKEFLPNIQIINYKKNRGKGYALRMGSLLAYKQKYESIVWIDGDGQLHPKDIIKFVKALDAKTDYVVHHRLIDFKVLPLSKVGRSTVRILFNYLFEAQISDHLSGLKAFKSEILPVVLWRVDDYRVEVEFLARAVCNKLKYKTVTSHCDQKLYQGIGWQQGLMIYYWIVWCFFHRQDFSQSMEKITKKVS
jgi:glycosyltransferase involved in cell wall biosynthesis